MAVGSGWSAGHEVSCGGGRTALTVSHPQIVRGAPIDALEQTSGMPSHDIDPSVPDRHRRVPRELAARLSDLVPGGAHTYAKGDDQYPEGLAPIIARGSGATSGTSTATSSSSTAWVCGRSRLVTRTHA